MAITDFGTLSLAPKQRLHILKTGSIASLAGLPFTVFDQAGNPGAGAINPANTTTGLVPTDATTGYPTINAFSGGATGYLSQVIFTSSVACTLMVFDRLFTVGNITMTTATVTTTLGSQPSYAARVPNGDYGELEIWLETGAPALSNVAHTVSVGYTKEDGVTSGRSTGNLTAQNLTARRMSQFPLQAGDVGPYKIDSITANGIASSAGVFNINVMRPLWSGRVDTAGRQYTHGPLETQCPIVYADSALFLMVIPDSTATGIPSVRFFINNG